MRNKLIASFIALALCVSWFYLTREQGLGNIHCMVNRDLSVATLDSNLFYGPNVWPVWRARIGGMWVSGELFKFINPGTAEQFKDAFGLYQSLWLGATFALIIGFIKRPAFIIFATFSGLIYTYSSHWQEINILPWDRPSTFFWTLAYVLWDRKLYWNMVIAIIIGTIFKETVAVAAFLLLFSDKWWSIKSRHFLCAAIGCIIVKLLISHFILGFAALNTTHNTITWATSVHYFWTYWRYMVFAPTWSNLLWVNAGLLWLALILKSRDYRERGIKWTLFMFVCGVFTSNIIDNGPGNRLDMRQWQDVLVLAAVYCSNKIE